MIQLSTQQFDIDGIRFHVSLSFDDKKHSASAEIVPEDEEQIHELKEIIERDEFGLIVSQDENFQVFIRYARAVTVVNILFDDIVLELTGRVDPSVGVYPAVMPVQKFIDIDDFIRSQDDEVCVILDVKYPNDVHTVSSIIMDLWGRDAHAVMDIPGGRRILVSPPSEAAEVDFRNPYVSIDVVLKETRQTSFWN